MRGRGGGERKEVEQKVGREEKEMIGEGGGRGAHGC